MIKNIYSKSEEKQIINLWSKGMTAPDIAKELNRTASSVKNKIVRMQKDGLINVKRKNTSIAHKFIHKAKNCGIPLFAINSLYNTAYNYFLSNNISPFDIDEITILYLKQHKKCALSSVPFSPKLLPYYINGIIVIKPIGNFIKNIGVSNFKKLIPIIYNNINNLPTTTSTTTTTTTTSTSSVAV